MILTNQTFFKALDGVQATNGGDYRYPGVGRWTKHVDGELVPCERGYHVAQGKQVLDWLAPTVYVAEVCPDHDPINAVNKWVTCRVRLVRRLAWDDSSARLFAADCAEGALLGERACGREPDERLWGAVAAARAFARGQISGEDLAAARAAAREVAGAAAWAAARAAAWDVAWDVAWYAAGAAAREVAGAVAGAVAGDVAGDVAWDVAWDVAREAQFSRWCAYVTGTEIPPVTPLYVEVEG